MNMQKNPSSKESPVDYAMAYSALAHRLMSARVFLQHGNVSGAQTLLNECAEQIRMIENPRMILRPNAEEALNPGNLEQGNQ
jgi:hypothetical protein